MPVSILHPSATAPSPMSEPARSRRRRRRSRPASRASLSSGRSLARLGFDDLVKHAGYPGSGMVPATSALLSLLALKLIDKERRSHISDFNFDEALGLFAGLNILPKATFATDYSYRTVRENPQRLLAGWISKLLPRLDPEPDASAWTSTRSRIAAKTTGWRTTMSRCVARPSPASSRSSLRP